MPLYEYRCKSCGKTHEIEHGFHDERPTSCPSCGGLLVRVFHPVGVVFKGSGFHKTDYSSSGLRKDGAASGSSSDASKGETKSGDAKTSESKPTAAKTESKAAGDGKASGGDSKPSKSAST
jgi:putative FmdB family regulatory protein